MICKVVIALCHGTNENGNAFILIQTLDIIPYSDRLRVKAKGDFTAVWW